MEKIILLTAILSIFLSLTAKDLSKYDYLLEPQISEKSTIPVLQYTAVGDPSVSSNEAFSSLYPAFFKLKRKFKLELQPSRARWPISHHTPREEWIGRFCLPINDRLTDIPEKISKKYPKLEISSWEYGTVAEILHLGSYAEETPTIEQLHQFITDSGYEIVGAHEEEYLKGPGMFGKGNPDKYRTIIRYQVREIEK